MGLAEVEVVLAWGAAEGHETKARANYALAAGVTAPAKAVHPLLGNTVVSTDRPAMLTE